MDFDITNNQEMGAIGALALVNGMLIWFTLMNFRQICKWKFMNLHADQWKLVKVNALLMLSLVAKLFYQYFGLFGCMLSELPSFNQNSVDWTFYFNWGIYVSMQQFQVLIFNITMLLCSYYWLQVVIVKQQVKLANGKQSKVGSHFKIINYILLTFMGVLAIFSIAQMMLEEFKYIQMLIAISTLVSSLIFGALCLKLFLDLDSFYQVDTQYKHKLKTCALALLFTQIFRVAFNIASTNGGSLLPNFKQGYQTDTHSIPDQTYQWAIFLIVYNSLTDLIPIYLIGKLFTPQTKSQASLLKVEDDWDIQSVA